MVLVSGLGRIAATIAATPSRWCRRVGSLPFGHRLFSWNGPRAATVTWSHAGGQRASPPRSRSFAAIDCASAAANMVSVSGVGGPLWPSRDAISRVWCDTVLSTNHLLRAVVRSESERELVTKSHSKENIIIPQSLLKEPPSYRSSDGDGRRRARTVPGRSCTRDMHGRHARAQTY